MRREGDGPLTEQGDFDMNTPDATTTLQWLCTTHEGRVATLFEQLDLDRPAFSAVRAAALRNDLPEACRGLLTYYRRRGAAGGFPEPEPGWQGGGAGESDTEAGAQLSSTWDMDDDPDAILAGRHTHVFVPGTLPRLPGGGYDWSYNGPDNEQEWGWGLNRHAHLTILLRAYLRTGDLAYVRCCDENIRDWVLCSPYPGEESDTPQWRGLEVALRLCQWARTFRELQAVDAFSPAARILLLSSVPDHAHYNRHFHQPGSNWVVMEMVGLATAAVYWPEFADADGWRAYAAQCLLDTVSDQVYPDGAQKELTTHYHMVVLKHVQHAMALLRQSAAPQLDALQELVLRLLDYVAYALGPDGHCLLNNDSDRLDLRPILARAARHHARPDWTWIATNGKSGTRPAGLPSVFFPWAGQLIMRSGWDRAAHWAMFDVGPSGVAHQHNDKLNLVVSAFGRDLLVDTGRYTYVPGPWNLHFKTSASHNVILLNGQGQLRDEAETTEPGIEAALIEPEFDFARGRFDRGFRDFPTQAEFVRDAFDRQFTGEAGTASHTRAVLYLRGALWVVVDRVTCSGPGRIDALWHFHPECTLRREGVSVTTIDQDMGNLRIVPAGVVSWQLDIVAGRTVPTIQGWYSPRYNEKHPAPTAVYSASIDRSAVFAWILVPARGSVPPTRAEWVAAGQEDARLRIQVEGEAPWDLTIPLTKGPPGVARG